MKLTREEVLSLLRLHTETFAGYLDEGNRVPKNVLMEGSGPANVGGLRRINELFELLPDEPPK